jgi:inorganic pyrophosphatase
MVIDRPKASAHPRFPEFIYPVDYGYLAGTTGGDGDPIDICVGTGNTKLRGYFETRDDIKRDR